MVIKGIHYYKQGTIRVLGSSLDSFNPTKLNTRGGIKKLSKKSLQRMALIVNETEVEFKSIITLTYPKDFISQGRKVKVHLNEYLKYLKYVYPLCGYFWILEFQARGAPHFHILVDRIPDNRERSMLAMKWSEIVVIDADKVFYRHNKPEHCEAIRERDGAKRYIMMYALKPQQKKVPNGYHDVGRFWGCNRKVLSYIPKPEYIKMDEAQLRDFLRGSGQYACDFDKFPLVLYCRKNVSRETIAQNIKNTLTRASINDTLVSE